MNNISSRINELRSEMKKNQADWFFATSDDFHGSEYVADYFKVREHYTGFTGENAFLIVDSETAYMWTDGRFFIQAEIELKDTGITLMKMGEPGVPTIRAFIKDRVTAGQRLFFDGRMVTTALGKAIENIVRENEAELVIDNDIAGKLWTDRPALPVSNLRILDISTVGETLDSKLSKIRIKMEDEGCAYHFLGSLDDIAWITNVRGKDIECNPVFLSYLFVTKNDCIIFMEKEEASAEIASYFGEHGIRIEDYNSVSKFLSDYNYNGSVLLDEGSVNYACYKVISSLTDVVNKINPSTVLKACKNAVEVKNLKEAYLEDSVCVAKFTYWIKNAVKEETLTEISAADYLDNLRRGVPGFLDLSFPTISGYGPNGAIVHYSATKESNAALKPEGMILVDSGGQYDKGTTDVTRTIALGPVTDDMRLHYTKTAIGMLSLAKARFMEGCTGRNLDILSRIPLWNLGVDFKHGTGHGIGYILNVHEGPQNIRSKFVDGQTEYPIEPGMITSDEPGVYIEGQYGIRIENVILCVEDIENEYGKFYKFEHLTFAPLERELLDKSVMSLPEIEMVNEYQALVYEKINALLTPSEREWLKAVTAPL